MCIVCVYVPHTATVALLVSTLVLYMYTDLDKENQRLCSILAKKPNNDLPQPAAAFYTPANQQVLRLRTVDSYSM